MHIDSKQILEAALKLPEDERLTLAAHLLETLPDEPDGLSLDEPDLLKELQARSADQSGAISWDDIRDKL